jgi:peptidoglycan/LPS O-acetylase OafA/YrhL
MRSLIGRTLHRLDLRRTIGVRIFLGVVAGAGLVLGLDMFDGDWGSVGLGVAVGAALGCGLVAFSNLHQPDRTSRKIATSVGILALGVSGVLAGSFPDLMPYLGGAIAGCLGVVAVAAPASYFRTPRDEERWDDKGTWIGRD